MREKQGCRCVSVCERVCVTVLCMFACVCVCVSVCVYVCARVCARSLPSQSGLSHTQAASVSMFCIRPNKLFVRVIL